MNFSNFFSFNFVLCVNYQTETKFHVRIWTNVTSGFYSVNAYYFNYLLNPDPEYLALKNTTVKESFN